MCICGRHWGEGGAQTLTHSSPEAALTLNSLPCGPLEHACLFCQNLWVEKVLGKGLPRQKSEAFRNWSLKGHLSFLPHFIGWKEVTGTDRQHLLGQNHAKMWLPGFGESSGSILGLPQATSPPRTLQLDTIRVRFSPDQRWSLPPVHASCIAWQPLCIVISTSQKIIRGLKKMMGPKWLRENSESEEC